jgi:hypothetical protein
MPALLIDGPLQGIRVNSTCDKMRISELDTETAIDDLTFVWRLLCQDGDFSHYIPSVKRDDLLVHEYHRQPDGNYSYVDTVTIEDKGDDIISN